AARFQVSRGVDVIKLMTSESRLQPDGSIFWPQEMDYEMIRAAVVEAEKVGIHTAAHCHGGPGITDTIRAGVTSLEHAHWLTDEQLALMCEHGTYLCPTFSCNAVLHRRGLEGTDWPAWRTDWLKRVIEDKADTFDRALAAGVKIVSGSDAATSFNYHGRCVEELGFMVDAGMKPMDVIVAATSRAAQLLGMENLIGSLREGMLADLIVVDGDPLADMRVFVEKQNVKLVVKDGVPLVDRMGLADRPCFT
ncbi:MAG: amidohydrolase family protein, partial [Clostridia bacterium]